MFVPSRGAWLDTWERRMEVVFDALPYLLLAISVVLTVVARGGSGASLLVDLAPAGLAAAWMLWMVTLHPTWVARPRLMAVYFAVLVALMAALVVRAPWFGFFTWTGYLIAFRVLRNRWRFVGFAAVAVVTATSQYGGLPSPNSAAVIGYVVIVLINVLLVGVITWFTAISFEQNERRKQALTELAEANRRLETMLEENAGLHVQLLTQAREAGILDERQRLAREIHDTLAQDLTGIITQLEAAEQASNHPDAWRAHIDQARSLARDGLSEARRSVQALRPERLEGSHLPDAIADMGARWSESASVPLRVETTGQPMPLLAELEVALFRVAQEALTNVAKHAGASKVGLTLSYMDDMVLLDVRDDGIGFTAGPAPASVRSSSGHGFGLKAMDQRVRRVGGQLEIESAPGAGTAISASVPAIPAEGGR